MAISMGTIKPSDFRLFPSISDKPHSYERLILSDPHKPLVKKSPKESASLTDLFIHDHSCKWHVQPNLHGHPYIFLQTYTLTCWDEMGHVYMIANVYNIDCLKSWWGVEHYQRCCLKRVRSLKTHVHILYIYIYIYACVCVCACT